METEVFEKRISVDVASDLNWVLFISCLTFITFVWKWNFQI